MSKDNSTNVLPFTGKKAEEEHIIPAELEAELEDLTKDLSDEQFFLIRDILEVIHEASTTEEQDIQALRVLADTMQEEQAWHKAQEEGADE